MKILVSAYTCSPYKGSEHSVGWGFISTLARYHDLWVITEEEECRADIEQWCAENPKFCQSVQFYFIYKRRNHMLRKAWPPSYYWYYRRWHKDAFALARELHSRINFDLAHQLTMVGFREPGYLWKLGIPFVWGPVGGMGLFPWRFLYKMGVYGSAYYVGYNLFNLMHMYLLRRPKLAAYAAGPGLITMNEENRKGFWRCYGLLSEVCIPVGPPQVKVADMIIQRAHSEPLRLVWTGLHIPRKALNLGLEALARLPKDIAWELHILGQGRRTIVWRRLAERVGIARCCYFYGWLSRDQALAVMRNAHLMLFTSLREGTPTVIPEAFSLALPVICLDCSGMIDMVDGTCGIKTPVTTPKEVIRELAIAIEQLARNEDRRQQLALGALARAHDFAWERKIDLLNRIYTDRLQEAARKVKT